MILLVGIALVAIGAACLYLSGAVARDGSWSQGTLDAFGVGLVVGGIVDVTAISLLNQLLTGDTDKWSRRRNRKPGTLLDEAERMMNQFAERLVEEMQIGSPMSLQARQTEIPSLKEYQTLKKDITEFIHSDGDAIDPVLRAKLVALQARFKAGNQAIWDLYTGEAARDVYRQYAAEEELEEEPEET